MVKEKGMFWMFTQISEKKAEEQAFLGLTCKIAFKQNKIASDAII